MSLNLQQSLDRLAADFPRLPWDFREQRVGRTKELVSQWLGAPDEDIMVCLFRGREIHERFHRQDFFFINYAYEGDYGAQSYHFDKHITIRQDDCYIGQPFSGYALYGAGEKDIAIAGVLIRREVFYRNFLQTVSDDRRLLHFFLEPEINRLSDEFIHLENLNSPSVRSLMELMIVEYANRGPCTQNLLKPMTLALIMMLARQFRQSRAEAPDEPAADRMIRFMDEHVDSVTLSMLAKQFGYHPSYISGLLSKKTGRTFSRILLSQRMERAVLLMRSTDLSLEEIAPLLGYADKSNFHKAFREYYGVAPRQWLKEHMVI